VAHAANNPVGVQQRRRRRVVRVAAQASATLGPVSRYDGDVLAGNWRRPRVVPEVPAVRDLVVEDAETGFCGAVVRSEQMPGGATVTLEDRRGRLRAFPLGPGFLVDGSPVTLVGPTSTGPTSTGPPPRRRTASGSFAVATARARVAVASRIYVEGRHDAELVERVWGDDLRIEGLAVEYLGGINDLVAVVRDFRPGRGRRLGVLVDHLVAGSKESRIAAEIASPHVLVVGHPYIDVWQAVRPAAVGIPAWPEVPRGQPWKEGVCSVLGWPIDTAAAWRRILSCVDSYADLEPSLLGRVEEVIDFVTIDPHHP
jgi:Protein of unknown function (DUF3097)